MAYKHKLSDVRLGDAVIFSTPGAGFRHGVVAKIEDSSGTSFPSRTRIFLTAEGDILNPYPDGGTDVQIVTKGPKPEPTPEDIAYQKKMDAAYQEMMDLPNGSGYMLYSHKSTGTVVIKISESQWLHYDYSGYGGYEAYMMNPDEVFYSYLWDEDEEAMTFEEKLKVSGL
ncbi:hypothetical protein SEA_ATUIN_230 [Arthrobacter phage Atuin]|nr:hypothetical protein SEA_ATUIN_29 [Arthrobacter phage Atuin]